LLVLLGVMTTTVQPSIGQTSAPDPSQRNLRRAVVAYDAMLEAFYEPGSKLFLEVLGSEQYAFQWPFARAMTATAALARVPGAALRYRLDLLDQYEGIEWYWDPYWEPPAYASAVLAPWGGGGDRYYDDNNWIGLALLDVYRLTGDTTALKRAREVFAFVVSGWQDNPYIPASGGVRWIDAWWNWDRNTISTAPAAMLALQLAELTTDPDERREYVDWARRLYGWVQREMRDDATGLYYDRITWAGDITRDINVDNQGAMIGAGVLFYRLTGDTRYLEEALATARAILAFHGGDWVQGAPPKYVIVLFQGLELLSDHVRDPALVEPIQRYADQRWETQRDSRTSLFTTTEPLMLIDQAALVEIYAMLARLTDDELSISTAAAGAIAPPTLLLGRQLRLTPVVPADLRLMADWRGGASVSVFQPFVARQPPGALTTRWAGDADAVPRFLVAARPAGGDELLGVAELTGDRWPERVTSVTAALDASVGGGLRNAVGTLQLALRFVVNLRVTRGDRPQLPEDYLEP
jgi:hypothetical protein